MSNAVASLRSRVEVAPGALPVALGDVALIALFVVVGQLSHDINPVADPLRTADTLAPFLVGWAIVSLVYGAYSPRAFASAKAAAAVTGVTWVSAALVGQVLRGSSLFHGNFTVAFAIVSIVAGLVLLVPWRIALSTRR